MLQTAVFDGLFVRPGAEMRACRVPALAGGSGQADVVSTRDQMWPLLAGTQAWQAQRIFGHLQHMLHV